MRNDTELTPLRSLVPDQRPKVLLVGNGINLSFPSGIDSWKDIIKTELAHSGSSLSYEQIKDMPTPMQIVVATADHVNVRMKELAGKLAKIEPPSEQKLFIREMLDCQPDAILTTNYSLEIEKSVIEPFTRPRCYQYGRQSHEATKKQDDLGIFRCTELPYGNHPYLWHIHGTCLKPASLIMGHYYYGSLIHEAAAYIPQFMRIYKGKKSSGTDYSPASWIDYLLTGDVHVIGLQMDISESDLWWLICCKKRNFPDTKICYYTLKKENHAKELLMQSYGVEIVYGADLDIKEDYLDFYREAFRCFKNTGNSGAAETLGNLQR